MEPYPAYKLARRGGILADHKIRPSDLFVHIGDERDGIGVSAVIVAAYGECPAAVAEHEPTSVRRTASDRPLNRRRRRERVAGRVVGLLGGNAVVRHLPRREDKHFDSRHAGRAAKTALERDVAGVPDGISGTRRSPGLGEPVQPVVVVYVPYAVAPAVRRVVEGSEIA